MKKQESGRSMVEMLGVLAIIGVLSIGGIAGYVLSMNRFRANGLIDKASKFATVAYSAKQTAIAMGKTDFDPTALDFSKQKLGDLSGDEALAIKSIADDGTVTVTATFADGGVCETAQSILNIDTACSGTGTATLDLEFKQS